MKKIISVLLSALLITSAAACSSDENSSDSSSESLPDSVINMLSDSEKDTSTDTADDNTDTSSQSQFLDGETDSSIENEDTDTETDSDINITETNSTSCKIFRKVVCCGDSYTAGFIVDSEGTTHKTNEDFAWPHYMSTLTGNDWLNCGCSGCNVLTWQEHSRGLPAAKKYGKAQAYVIGLGINDVGVKNHVELGTIKDIGTDKKTYYGGMSAIIRQLNEISPKAKIFVNTCPKPDEGYIPYNQAIRDIVDEYKDKYPVHCIDLAANAYMYETDVLKEDYWHGHYTAVGYEKFAEIYSVILSQYIDDHIKEFQDVAFIEYDK